jgi:hypothetical protein
MTNRRHLLQSFVGLSAAAPRAQAAPWPASDHAREYWLGLLQKLAEPVLVNLARGALKENMSVETSSGNSAERKRFTHLEAIGRLLCGIAPWLECALDGGEERALQQRYRKLARQAIHSATDPHSPDFLNFSDGDQPVVDCGFLSQALLRAPKELWQKLEPATQRNLVSALQASRAIVPSYNN